MEKIWFVGPKGDYPKVQYATIMDVYEYCKDKAELGVDIETRYKFPKGTFKNEDIYRPGIDPYLTDVVMLQIGDLENVFVIDVRTVNISILIPLFEDPDRIWIGANLRFEAKHLLHNYGILFHRIWDIQLVDMNLTNGLGWSKHNPTGLRYSLEALADRYLGIPPITPDTLFTKKVEKDDANYEEEVFIDKSIRMGFLTIGSKPFTEKQILYGAGDITYPLEIKKRQKGGRNGYNPTVLHELENEFCLVLADMELKGITFNKEQWIKTAEASQIVYDRRLKRMNEYVIKHHPKFCTIADLFGTPAGCAIEWSSPTQVVKFFRHLGFCPQEKSKQTKQLEYTAGATALQKLLCSEYKEKYIKDKETEIVTQEDLILNYLLLKVAEQAVTTFGMDWLKYIHPITGRVHSTYRQILNTGRISSSNPNAQNIPGDKEYRMAFIAPPGYKLLNADYASQESRILAEVSGDKDMVSFFNDGHPIFGDDFHSFTGTKMFSLMRKQPDLIISKETHKEERNTAKNISFKVAYGGSAYTLKDDFGVSEEVAQEFIDSFLNAFPSLKEYFERVKKFAEKNGYIEIDSITGRRYYEPDFPKLKILYEKATAMYPKNYKSLSAEDKKKVKDKLNITHPSIRGYWKEYFTIQGSLHRAAMNYRIQGLAGSQTKKAAILFRRYCIENNLRDILYLTMLVHDEMSAEVAEGHEEMGAKVLIDKMKEGAQTYCLNVKMDAAGGECPWWGH